MRYALLALMSLVVLLSAGLGGMMAQEYLFSEKAAELDAQVTELRGLLGASGDEGQALLAEAEAAQTTVTRVGQAGLLAALVSVLFAIATFAKRAGAMRWIAGSGVALLTLLALSVPQAIEAASRHSVEASPRTKALLFLGFFVAIALSGLGAEALRARKARKTGSAMPAGEPVAA